MTFANYINGEWVSGDTFENRNPANTDEVVGLFVKGTPSDVDAAAEAASQALAGWSKLPGPSRGAYLFKVAEILDRKFDDIAADMTREEGKTLPEAKGEVRRSINIPPVSRRSFCWDNDAESQPVNFGKDACRSAALC